MTVNSTVNVYHQILDKYIFNLPEKNWEYSGVMVDEVWQISEFYLKNWIFENILNSALMGTTAANVRVESLNIIFSLMKQNTYH